MLSIQTVETAVDMVVVIKDTALLTEAAAQMGHRFRGSQATSCRRRRASRATSCRKRSAAGGGELPEAAQKDAVDVTEEEEESEAETATENVCSECGGVLMFHAQGLRICKACGYIMESVHVYSCESESD